MVCGLIGSISLEVQVKCVSFNGTVSPYPFRKPIRVSRWDQIELEHLSRE